MTAHEIRTALARPFPAGDVKLKPKRPKGCPDNRCLAMSYIDARLVMDRLDDVLGVDGWQDEYTPLPDGSVLCRLTVHIEGVAVTRSDVGSPSEQSGGGDRLKAAFSDSLKRTAVKFGIGRYLYAIPAIWMDYDPTTKRIVVRPTASPVEAARQRFTAARSTDALAREWEATPPDLRSQLVADKERRKKELAAG